MSGRNKFEYIATLHSSEGETVEEKFHCYWSPNFDGVLDEVSKAAAVIKNVAARRIAASGGQIVEWLGVSARYEKTV